MPICRPLLKRPWLIVSPASVSSWNWLDRHSRLSGPDIREPEKAAAPGAPQRRPALPLAGSRSRRKSPSCSLAGRSGQATRNVLAAAKGTRSGGTAGTGACIKVTAALWPWARPTASACRNALARARELIAIVNRRISGAAVLLRFRPFQAVSRF